MWIKTSGLSHARSVDRSSEACKGPTSWFMAVLLPHTQPITPSYSRRYYFSRIHCVCCSYCGDRSACAETTRAAEWNQVCTSFIRPCTHTRACYAAKEAPSGGWCEIPPARESPQPQLERQSVQNLRFWLVVKPRSKSRALLSL
jgi:hypothetical protein